MVKALGLIFSARKRGNCYDCANYCLDRLREESIETQLINIHDYTIEPCNHCNYECFSERIRGTKEICPINDDLPQIYHEFEDSSIIILGVPTYVGQVPSLFRIFEERRLGSLERKKLWIHCPEQLFCPGRGYAYILRLRLGDSMATIKIKRVWFRPTQNRVNREPRR